MRALLSCAAARRIAASTPLRRRPPATASAARSASGSASAEDYTPHHITATAADMRGNGPHGRYWLVPGSMDRAAQLATHLTDPVAVRESPRGHHAHLGVLERDDGPPVDVGVVSTGMGCPTVDIILTELIRLGGRRFIRIGSAGGLQPHRGVGVGTCVIGTGGVRDEGTSQHYAPLEFPAVASPLLLEALQTAAVALGPAVASQTFAGLIHSKDSLMAREFHEGCRGPEHVRYMQNLREMGVLASEMEASHMFVLGAAHSHKASDAPAAIPHVGATPGGAPPAGADEVRSTPLKNGGDHSFGSRFGPLRNRPPVLWCHFLESWLQDGENREKTRKNGAKMGEIWPKKKSAGRRPILDG